jgi:hypothetical protein
MDWTGCIAKKRLPDGREAIVWPLTFDRARLSVGEPNATAYDDGW